MKEKIYIIHRGSKSSWPKKILIYTDGASRGNPGAASAGLVVYNEQLNILYEEAVFLGEQTNNFAEYSAILRALELSCQNTVNALTVKSDSELLVKQLSGIYKVKSANIKALYQKCKALVEKIPVVDFQHVYREQNQKADELANLILDQMNTHKI